MDLPSSWIALGAAVTAVIAGWNTVKSWLGFAFALPIQQIEIEEPEIIYFKSNMATAMFAPARYCGGRVVRNGTSKLFIQQIAAWYESGQICLFWYRWRPVFVDNRRLYFIRGTFKAQALAAAIIRETDDRVRLHASGTRFNITRIHGLGSIHSRRLENNSTANNVAGDRGVSLSAPNGVPKWAGCYLDGVPFLETLPTPQSVTRLYVLPSVLATINSRVDRFLESREWFASRDIAWRLGILLTGKPGTGKSTYAMWLAETKKIPIFIFDLASMSNEEFIKSWTDLGNQAPCIALIEDIDGVFDGRTNLAKELGGGLTFDCLLNALSGAFDVSGVLTIITSNHPEKIDEALRFRPGRIDAEIEIGGLEDHQMRHIATQLIDDLTVREAVLSEYAGKQPPAAAFRNTCVAAALTQYASYPDKSSTKDLAMSTASATPNLGAPQPPQHLRSTYAAS